MELSQIESAAVCTTYTLLNAKANEAIRPIAASTAIRKLGRKVWLNGLNRSAFHWTSVRYTKDGRNIEKFKEIAKVYYNIPYTLANPNASCDRYALYADLPFYAVNQLYNAAYAKDNEIGSTYDWISDYPTEEEIAAFKAK